ncbi:MAG TPA: hypothetical protein VK841_10035 [Polyangiaceae bacterium]|jgi:hypothetical protein|nr:hypothetical protein [Polyangiaceae bacterium]
MNNVAETTNETEQSIPPPPSGMHAVARATVDALGLVKGARKHLHRAMVRTQKAIAEAEGSEGDGGVCDPKYIARIASSLREALAYIDVMPNELDRVEAELARTESATSAGASDVHGAWVQATVASDHAEAATERVGQVRELVESLYSRFVRHLEGHDADAPDIEEKSEFADLMLTLGELTKDVSDVRQYTSGRLRECAAVAGRPARGAGKAS